LYDAVGPAEEFEVRSVVVTETQEGLGSGPTIQDPHVGAAPFIGNQRDALAIAIITGTGRRIKTHREPPIRLEPEPKAFVAGRVVDGESDGRRDPLPFPRVGHWRPQKNPVTPCRIHNNETSDAEHGGCLARYGGEAREDQTANGQSRR